VWICGRSSDPEFTLDDARKVKLSDLEVEVGSADPTPPPTDPVGGCLQSLPETPDVVRSWSVPFYVERSKRWR